MLSDAMFIVAAAARSSSSPFWSTVAGALVGGFVSLATTLLVEYQRNRKTVAAERRRALSEAALGRRVVSLELRDIESVLRVALQNSPFEWPPTQGFRFQTIAWENYAPQLGTVVPEAIWQAAAAPYSTFAYANLVGNVSRDAAASMLDETQKALEALNDWDPRKKSSGDTQS